MTAAARSCGNCRNGYPGTELPCVTCKDQSGWATVRVSRPPPAPASRKHQRPGSLAGFQSGLRAFMEGTS